MKQQLSLHLKKFNDRVKVMNQTNAKELVLNTSEARQLQADIFDLLNKINDLTAIQKNSEEPTIINLEGGNF